MKRSAQTCQLVIASKNIHKIREIKAILNKALKIDILTLLDFPDYVPPCETNNSFQENAILKAQNAAKALNKWVLADDSGLIVPSLGGQPGVLSARFAGNDATDADNRKKLLAEMEDLKEHERQAYFECCISLASPEGVKKVVNSTCEGIIISKEKGGGGFGYDPLFVKHDYSKTFAELEESVKNRISHRRKALDRIMPALELLAR